MADLLIELFSEEIPARMQTQAARDLSKLVTDGLKEAGLTFDEAPAFVTPRRLTLCVNGLPDKTPDISEERRGPRTDAPEKALDGFMRGAGVTRDQLEEREEKKGTFFFAKIEKPGRPTGNVVAEVLEATIRNFPWPKSQRWGSSSLKWVRPLRNILCILDGAAVDLTVDGFTANNKTFGHRFMAPEWFEVTDFADYEQKLLDHKVIVNADKRADAIAAGISSLTSEKGLEWVEDKGLLREVAGLVEWPVPLMGSFDPAFMAVPEEVLILTMKKDQKYFVTRNPETGDLAPYFITVANTETVDGGTMVRDGNERVLSARLADAKFFWDQDLKGRLDDNLAALDDIVFHIELGKVSDRVARMKSLARKLADFIPGCDATEAERAAELAKADLVSQMVYEFPEVQGVMGRYYAKAQGETDAVADAIRDHYAPAGPSDTCPTAPVSVAVALAEKLDTLVGFFGIDQKPTGSKDPYALRRAALGVIRLITENGIRLPLSTFISSFITDDNYIQKNSANVGSNNSNNNIGVSISFSAQVHKRMPDGKMLELTAFELLKFFGDRLKVQQRDLGVRHDLIDAVFAKGDDDLVRILGRVDALGSFLGTDDGVNLLAGYKRAANILKIEEKKDGTEYGADVSAALLSQEEEITLFEALGAAETDALVALEQENFEASMTALSTLRAPIDAFFDKVTVNADDAALRANRLALLAKIRAAVNTVADFGQIEG